MRTDDICSFLSFRFTFINIDGHIRHTNASYKIFLGKKIRTDKTEVYVLGSIHQYSRDDYHIPEQQRKISKPCFLIRSADMLNIF